MVIPRESEWFGAFKEGAEAEVVPMEQQPLYQEDWIGLRQLNNTNRLDLLVGRLAELDLYLDWLGSWLLAWLVLAWLLVPGLDCQIAPFSPVPLYLSALRRSAPATTCSLPWSGSPPTSFSATLCKPDVARRHPHVETRVSKTSS
jgi:hypothetical protein